jgi:hypothetical protein
MKASTRSLIKEARAVLEGTARTTTYEGCTHAPAWAYVNQLAHARPAQLAELAGQGWSEYRHDFHDASAFLAGELLARTDGSRSLAQAQRALIRLELDLLDGKYPPSAPPAALVGWVLHTLATSGYGRPGW